MPKSNRGGARANSGRLPGPLTTGHVGLLEAPSPALTPLQPVDPAEIRIREAGAFYLRGFSYTEIGLEMGVDRQTVSHWLRSRPELLDSERIAKRDPAGELARHIPAATQAYADLLQPETRQSVRLEAANAIYDRVYGKPLVRTEAHERRDIRVLLLKASDLSPGDELPE